MWFFLIMLRLCCVVSFCFVSRCVVLCYFFFILWHVVFVNGILLYDVLWHFVIRFHISGCCVLIFICYFMLFFFILCCFCHFVISCIILYYYTLCCNILWRAVMYCIFCDINIFIILRWNKINITHQNNTKQHITQHQIRNHQEQKNTHKT